MAKFIVQPFELIDVHHDHGHAGIKPPRPLQFFFNSQFEVSAIKDSGQAIQIGQMLHSFHVVRILNRRRTDVGD